MVDDITKGTIMSVVIVAILLIPVLLMVDGRLTLAQDNVVKNKVDDNVGVIKRVSDIQIKNSEEISATNAQQMLEAYEAQIVSGLTDISAKNPEQVLREAYSQQALIELDRCLGSGYMGFLCENNMKMLIESCKDQALHVTACDDPRLAEYRKQMGI